MWPWGHLAFGYVCYSLLVHVFRNRSPNGGPVVALAVGTQFPDLIDKPLAWSFHVLPSGRSFAHSLFTLVALVLVFGCYLYYRHPDRFDLLAGFAVGYGSHLIGDSIGAILAGRYAFVSFLTWPLTPLPPYGDEGGFLSHLASLDVGPQLLVRIGVPLLLVCGLWVYDGWPGLRALRSLFETGRRVVRSESR